MESFEGDIGSKLNRIRSGAPARVLDLFSGCGGLSLGFQRAGFQIVGAVESNSVAASSHGFNFHGGDTTYSKAIDITEVKPRRLATLLELGRTSEAIDVIVGGPPCQAFARVGRSKLREIDEHPEAFRHDPRAKLYTPYLDYVSAFRPLAILMENVPDVMNFGGHNIPEEICDVLERRGYVCAYTLLNAAYYGVPQMRERMFLVAYRRELRTAVKFPQPTHWIGLPSGYNSSRRVALKLVRASDDSGNSSHYVAPSSPKGPLPPAVSAHDALGDLPELYAREMLRSGALKRGARRFDQLMHYDMEKPVSGFADAMRQWPGFEGGEGIRDHVIRCLPRDFEIFSRMKPGDQYPQAYNVAVDLFTERLVAATTAGEKISPDTQAYAELWKSTVPPYDRTKFPNKWRKMWRDLPARTVMAHLGKDSYSHIHYDSRQARTISVREAARLQSFPDGFRFMGSMNQAFQQIGNAVPPLLAYALAEVIFAALQTAAKQDSYVTMPSARTG